MSGNIDLKTNTKENRSWIESHSLPNGWYICQNDAGQWLTVITDKEYRAFRAGSWAELVAWSEGLAYARLALV